MATAADHHRPQAAQYHHQRCYGDLGSGVRAARGEPGGTAVICKIRAPGADFCTRGPFLLLLPAVSLDEGRVVMPRLGVGPSVVQLVWVDATGQLTRAPSTTPRRRVKARPSAIMPTPSTR